MTIRFTTEWREMSNIVRQVLDGTDPVFIGRIGGSDTDMVSDYISLRSSGLSNRRIAEALQSHVATVKRYNGYYDKENNTDNIICYCETLLDTYKKLQLAFLVGSPLLTRYFPKNIHESFHASDVVQLQNAERIVSELNQTNIELLPYNFVEKMVNHEFTLFSLFAEALPGQRVLVISPFSDSIVSQFPRREQFFKDYRYPEFELMTLESPITYEGLPPSSIQTLTGSQRHADLPVMFPCWISMSRFYRADHTRCPSVQ